MLTKEEAQKIIKKALNLSPARATGVSIKSSTDFRTDFKGRSQVEQHRNEEMQIAIRVLHDDKMGYAVIDNTSSDAIIACCESALRRARRESHAHNIMPLSGRQSYYAVNGCFPVAADLLLQTHKEQAHHTLEYAADKGVAVSGRISSEKKSITIGNSQGLFGHQQLTNHVLSMDTRHQGYKNFSVACARDIKRIKGGKHVENAVDAAFRGTDTASCTSGKYALILEPLAVWQLLSLLVYGGKKGYSQLSGEAFHQKSGFIADARGKQIFSPNFTLSDDVYHPLHQGLPFDAEGMPRLPVLLIENGTPKNLVHSRASALGLCEEPTGHAASWGNLNASIPSHLVMRGGESSLQKMVAGTRQGIYISLFSHAEMSDPASLLITAKAEDRCCHIADGKMAGRISSVRLHKSLSGLLGAIIEAGQAYRVTKSIEDDSMVVPPILISEQDVEIDNP